MKRVPTFDELMEMPAEQLVEALGAIPIATVRSPLRILIDACYDADDNPIFQKGEP